MEGIRNEENGNNRQRREGGGGGKETDQGIKGRIYKRRKQKEKGRSRNVENGKGNEERAKKERM